MYVCDQAWQIVLHIKYTIHIIIITYVVSYFMDFCLSYTKRT